MTDFPFAIVGFDLDGTLVDTGDDLAAAVNHALVTEGRAPLSTAAVLARVGGGTRNMLAQVLADTGGSDDATIDRLLPVLLDHYAANIAVHSRPYPGAITVLDALAARGVRLAIVTNKLEGLARTLLDTLGLSARFATVIGGDTLPGRAKPDPAPIYEMIARLGGGRTAFVGDSEFDVLAAKAATVPVVACSFGFSGRAADTLGADAVIDHFDDLVPALERL